MLWYIVKNCLNNIILTRFKLIIKDPDNLLIESSFLDDGNIILTPISFSNFFCVDPLEEEDWRNKEPTCYLSLKRGLDAEFLTLFL